MHIPVAITFIKNTSSVNLKVGHKFEWNNWIQGQWEKCDHITVMVIQSPVATKLLKTDKTSL